MALNTAFHPLQHDPTIPEFLSHTRPGERTSDPLGRHTDVNRREVALAAQAAGVKLKSGRVSRADIAKLYYAIRKRRNPRTPAFPGSVWASTDRRDVELGVRQERVCRMVRMPSADWTTWEHQHYPNGYAFLTVGDPRNPRGSVASRLRPDGSIDRHRFVRAEL
jgi:hypothetical protein